MVTGSSSTGRRKLKGSPADGFVAVFPEPAFVPVNNLPSDATRFCRVVTNLLSVSLRAEGELVAADAVFAKSVASLANDVT
jgi:hypothetical protein